MELIVVAGSHGFSDLRVLRAGSVQKYGGYKQSLKLTDSKGELVAEIANNDESVVLREDLGPTS